MYHQFKKVRQLKQENLEVIYYGTENALASIPTELDWLDRFQAAKNDGFEAVEFWDWRIRDLDATREAAEKAGIAISGFNGDADYSLVDPTHKQKYLDYLKESIAAAKKVGAASNYHRSTHWVTAAL